MAGLDRRDGDIASGMVVIALGGAIYWHASGLPAGAAGFPLGISIALLIGGVLLLVRSLRTPRQGQTIAAGYRWSLLLIALALLVGLVAVVRPLGFFVPATVFIAVLSWILAGRPRTVWGIARPAIYAVLCSIGLWLVFVKVLSVAIPT